MVRIIDGEIVADDDPRVAAVRQPAAPRGTAASAAEHPTPRPTAGGLFDFDAPVLRLAPDDGTGLAGMPGVLLWGVRVPPQHLLLLLGCGLTFGWRGGVFACLLYLWWRASSAPRAAQQPTQQRMAAAQDYFARMMQQEPLGQRGSGAARGPGGAAAGDERRSAGAAAADPWAARGRPRRLNDQ